MANPASVRSDLVHASLALKATRGLKLATLFGPEHGIWANAQDLVEVSDSRDPRTGLPVHSLYGRTRVPTPGMLAGLDAVVVDLQDVGSRYYTFVYTMLHVLEACAREGRKVVILDRPNPLGRRGRGRQPAGARVRLLRGPAPPARAPRPHHRRAGPALPRGARARTWRWRSCACGAGSGR